MPQVTLLRELRPRPQLERVEISSVDGFQGVHYSFWSPSLVCKSREASFTCWCLALGSLYYLQVTERHGKRHNKLGRFPANKVLQVNTCIQQD